MELPLDANCAIPDSFAIPVYWPELPVPYRAW